MHFIHLHDRQDDLDLLRLCQVCVQMQLRRRETLSVNIVQVLLPKLVEVLSLDVSLHSCDDRNFVLGNNASCQDHIASTFIVQNASMVKK